MKTCPPLISISCRCHHSLSHKHSSQTTLLGKTEPKLTATEQKEGAHFPFPSTAVELPLLPWHQLQHLLSHSWADRSYWTTWKFQLFSVRSSHSFCLIVLPVLLKSEKEMLEEAQRWQQICMKILLKQVTSPVSYLWPETWTSVAFFHSKVINRETEPFTSTAQLHHYLTIKTHWSRN